MSDPKEFVFFLCTRCFRIRDTNPEGHEHNMIRLDTRELSEDQRKPLFDQHGNLVSRAPVWYLEAIDEIRESKRGS